MYVMSERTLSDAQEIDYYTMAVRSEETLLEAQLLELSDRRARRNAAWDNMTERDCRTYAQYRDAAEHYMNTQHSVVSAEAVIESTRARLQKYKTRLASF